MIIPENLLFKVLELMPGGKEFGEYRLHYRFPQPIVIKPALDRARTMIEEFQDRKGVSHIVFHEGNFIAITDTAIFTTEFILKEDKKKKEKEEKRAFINGYNRRKALIKAGLFNEDIIEEEEHKKYAYLTRPWWRKLLKL